MKYTIPGITAVVLVFSAINNVSGFQDLRMHYAVDPDMASEVMEINHFMTEHEDSQFLVIGAAYDNKVFNTYADEARHAYLVNDDVFWKNVPSNLTEEGISAPISDWELLHFPNDNDVPDPESIDYIVITEDNEKAYQRSLDQGVLLSNSHPFGLVGIANADLIYDGEYYRVYANHDPETISVGRIVEE